MVVQQTQTNTEEQVVPPQSCFSALCSELEEYEHLPELTPGNHRITGQNHEDAIDSSILAWLTQP
jgi:hypothetical protein